MLFRSAFAVIIILLSPQIYAEGTCKGNPVHLTFDDGPNPKSTPRVLQILEENKIPATFFVLLEDLEVKTQAQEVLSTILKKGHKVGVHGFDHDDYNTKKAESIRSDFSKMDTTLNNVSINGKLLKEQIIPAMRLPYGKGWVNPERYIPPNEKHRSYITANVVQTELVKRDWMHIGWHVDSQDYKLNRLKAYKTTSSQIMSETLASLEKNKGGVILLHDIHDSSPMFLQKLVTELKNRNYCFVGLEQFLIDDFLTINTYRQEKRKDKKYCQPKSENIFSFLGF